ncbi:MAG: recombinase family protein [Rhodospirillales bacterium]|nr:recombinase family protein [Rhodospirillales bacterium]MDE0710543.1 recombinase family protein [Rhodospirillales bacterium]
MTIRAALYARYSSDQQRAASIEDQFRVCREHAEREGWTVAATYKDSAISGDSVILRPGIQGLIERIVLTPGEKWGEIHTTLRGNLATIVEWTGNGRGKGGSGTPGSGLSVSAKTGTRSNFLMTGSSRARCLDW